MIAVRGGVRRCGEVRRRDGVYFLYHKWKHEGIVSGTVQKPRIEPMIGLCHKVQLCVSMHIILDIHNILYGSYTDILSSNTDFLTTLCEPSEPITTCIPGKLTSTSSKEVTCRFSMHIPSVWANVNRRCSRSFVRMTSGSFDVISRLLLLLFWRVVWREDLSKRSTWLRWYSVCFSRTWMQDRDDCTRNHIPFVVH